MHEVAPRIRIYRDLMPTVSNLYNYISNGDENTETKYLLFPWKKWKANWHGHMMQIPYWRTRDLNVIHEDSEFQNKIFEELENAFVYALEDYLKDFSDFGYLPYELKNIKLDKDIMSVSNTCTALRYSAPEKNKSNKIDENPMFFHSDTDPFDPGYPGEKLIITLTMYLNDDYEGGEIAFYDPQTSKVFKYKPKAGDITIFPSFPPFYHGVLPFDKGDRFLIRTFLSYDYKGDDFWNEFKSKFDEELLKEVEHERKRRSYILGLNNRSVVLSKDVDKKTQFQPLFIKNDPIEIIF